MDELKFDCYFDIIAYDSSTFYPAITERVPSEVGLKNNPVNMPDKDLIEKVEEEYDNNIKITVEFQFIHDVPHCVLNPQDDA
jgi:hypothetical protein